MKRHLLQILWAMLGVVTLLLGSVALYAQHTRSDLSPKSPLIRLASEAHLPPIVGLSRVAPSAVIDARYRSIASEIDDLECTLSRGAEWNSSAKRQEPPAPNLQEVHKRLAAPAEENASLRTLAPEPSEPTDRNRSPRSREQDRTTHLPWRSALPKLAIIMDDIHSFSEAFALKQISLPITPSIFPASSTHPDTPQIARMFAHYMVHLPMEAFCYDHPEERTLRVEDDRATIMRRLEKIRREFPRCIALNNHTGSKFTSDPEAMRRFFSVVSRLHMHFIDSRTSPTSVAERIAPLYHLRIKSRNVFLDNEANVTYILRQLSQAVAYAKRHGSAIAICHPRPETFRALKRCAPLLDGVEPVYVDAL